jgi:hypothetical protein
VPRRPLLLLAALLALVLAGCGQRLDTAELESEVKKAIADDTGVEVQAVDCPDDVEPEAGADFECTATGRDGTTAAAAVAQLGGGEVKITAPLLHVARAEQAIAAEIGGGTTLDCPDLVVTRAGESFRCSAVDSSGAAAELVVTFDDAAGNVSWELLPAE